MSGEEKGAPSRVSGYPAGGSGQPSATHFLPLPAPSGSAPFPRLSHQGPGQKCMWTRQWLSLVLWPWGHKVAPLLTPTHAPPLPWALHTLTICVGFINGDHALGLRMETKRNIVGGEGWKM